MVDIFSDHGLPFLLIGDFNARTGSLSDSVDIDRQVALATGIGDTQDIFLKMHPLQELGIKHDRTVSDKVINRNGKELIDMCKCMNMLIINGRVGHDGQAGRPTCAEASTIDYMLASPSLFSQLLNFQVDILDTLLSDKHCPITCTIRREPVTHPSKVSLAEHRVHTLSNVPRKNKGYVTKWETEAGAKFKTSFNLDLLKSLELEIAGLNPPNVTKADIDHISQSLSTMYINSGTKVGVTKKRKSHNPSKPWPTRPQSKAFFNEECKVHRKLYHQAKNKHRSEKSDTTKMLLAEASRKYRKTVKAAYKEHFRDLHSKLRNLKSKNPKDYWSLINMDQKSKPKLSEIPAAAFLEHFEKLNKGSNKASCDATHGSNKASGDATQGSSTSGDPEANACLS